MSDSAVRGTCEACGKSYRVPSASRTYACKACGATVRVAVATPVRAARAGSAGDAVPAPRRPPSERRRRAASSARTGWIVVGVVLAISATGYWLYRAGLVAKAAGAEVDLGKVTASFKDDWESGDLDEVAAWFHPDGRAAFRARLDAIVANRGWSGGFPAIVQKTERVIEGTVDEPAEGISILLWGDEVDSVSVRWQFEPSRRRWFAYAVELVPPPLGPRVAAFRAAWARSDPAALHPFFRADAKEKMAELVARKAAEAGWSARFPALGEPEITGEGQARTFAARGLGSTRPESVFPAGDGELLVKWAYRDEEDAWVVTGFRFP